MILKEGNKNLFFHIIFILFDIKNPNELNEKVLKEKMDAMSYEEFTNNFSNILQELCKVNFEELNSTIKESCLIFDETKLLFDSKLRSNDSNSLYENYLKDIDDPIIENYKESYNNINQKLATIFSQTTLDFFRYKLCKINLEDLTSDKYNIEPKLFTEIRYEIKRMITNYFSKRNKLLFEIIKEIFIIDNVSDKIVSLNKNLLYKDVVKLTQKTKIYILEIYLSFLEPLKIVIDKMNLYYNAYTIIKRKENIEEKKDNPSDDNPSDDNQAVDNRVDDNPYDDNQADDKE